MNEIQIPKAKYLGSLDDKDKENLEIVLEKLIQSLPDARILAIGSSVSALYPELNPDKKYKDLDIKIFGTKETIGELGDSVHRLLKELSDFEIIEGINSGKLYPRLCYRFEQYLNNNSNVGAYMVGRKKTDTIRVYRSAPEYVGRTIDVIISATSIERYIECAREQNLVYLDLTPERNPEYLLSQKFSLLIGRLSKFNLLNMAKQVSRDFAEIRQLVDSVYHSKSKNPIKKTMTRNEFRELFYESYLGFDEKFVDLCKRLDGAGVGGIIPDAYGLYSMIKSSVNKDHDVLKNLKKGQGSLNSIYLRNHHLNDGIKKLEDTYKDYLAKTDI